MATDWTTAQLGDLKGKCAIVTGANSGIGFHTALELGRAGTAVVIGCRDAARGAEALAQLQKLAPGAKFRLETLDLASLASVKAFADRFLATGEALDLLVNNAGLMALPTRELTPDGFELQFGTNHLGHFALTGRLLPALAKSAAPRVVTVSSSVTRMGAVVALDNLQSERRYSPMGTYGQSKLANQLFMIELGRRAPWLLSVAAHPGSAVSNLQKHAFKRLTQVFGQNAAQGAWASLRAATDAVVSGAYFGPGDFFGLRGPPVPQKLSSRAHDAELAKKLWDASETLTEVKYDFEHVRRAA